jgi:asparagine synthase (glutamine-hydrolysing)
MQDYFAINELLALNKVPENAVFIPGHSGAIAGFLLKQGMIDENFPIVDYLIENFYSLIYPHKKDLKVIRKEIEYLNNKKNHIPPYLIYENWGFRERTTKLIINASRTWDFFGYEYLHPLWDVDLFKFFRKIPFDYKINKKLFNEVLTEFFKEVNIYFPQDELFPSEKIIKKSFFPGKIKKTVSFS